MSYHFSQKNLLSSSLLVLSLFLLSPETKAMKEECFEENSLPKKRLTTIPLNFKKIYAQEYTEKDGTLTITTDNNNRATYQAITNRVKVTPGEKFQVPYDITVEGGGKMAFGVLNTKGDNWIGGEVILEAGKHKSVKEILIPEGESLISLVLRNYHLGTPGQSKFTAKLGLEKVEIEKIPLTFKKGAAQEYAEKDGTLTITTDNNNRATYQAITNRVKVTPGEKFQVPYDITVEGGGKMAFGVLNTKGDNWIGGEVILETGKHKSVKEILIPEGESLISLVLRNYHLGTPGQSKFTAKLGLEKEVIQKPKTTSIPLTFKKLCAQEYIEKEGTLTITTKNDKLASYQAETNRVKVTPGEAYEVPYEIILEEGGKMAFGVLNSARNGWIGGEVVLTPGTYHKTHKIMIPKDESEISLVLLNYHLATPGQSKFTAKLGLEKVESHKKKEDYFLLIEGKESQKNIGLEGLSFNEWEEIKKELSQRSLNIQGLEPRLNIIAQNQGVFFSKDIWKSPLNKQNCMQIINILLEGDEKQITALADALKDIKPVFSQIFEKLNLANIMLFNNKTVIEIVEKNCEFLKLCLFSLSADQIKSLTTYSLKKIEKINFGKLLSKDKVSIKPNKLDFEDKSELLSVILKFRKELTKSVKNGNDKAMVLLEQWRLNGDMIFGEKNFKEAQGWLTKAALIGNTQAMKLLGDMYRDGGGMKKDPQKAIEYYQKSATKGNAEALNALGKMYRDGDEDNGIKKDSQKAIEYYEKGAKNGNAKALNALGKIYRDGDGIEKNSQKAADYFKKAVELGNTQAISFLAKMYRDGDGVEKNPKIAIEYFKKIAENNVDVLMYLGKAYWFGEDIETNYNEAFSWFKKAANQDNAEALEFLAEMHRDGKGVNQDLKKAIDYYMKAAERGNSKAMIVLGKSYKEGKGVSKNILTSIAYYRLADKKESSEAACELGKIHRDGSVKKDPKKAINYFMKAANQGNAEAMTNLGEIYKNGEGVRINLEKARDWFIKAIERGSDTAGKSLIEIGSAEDMFAVANIYAYGFGKVNQDDKQAVKWYKRAARTGSIKAINALIEIYTLGRGNVEQDYEKVAKWALKAIEKGDNNAIFTLGYLYSMGSGVKKDDKKAVILWTEAAEKGNKEAWDYLGLYYTHGRGVTQDLEKASKCFENSLKNGGPFNAFTLGEIYRDGKEVQQNFEKAIGCFRKTLERGYGMFAGEAGNALGEMYRDGIGVEKNLEKAKEYFMKANKKGCSNAMKNLEEMLSGGRNVDKKEEVSLIIDKQEVEREEKEKTYLFIIQGNDVKEINNLAKIYYNERNFEKATELYKRATELLLSLQNKN